QETRHDARLAQILRCAKTACSRMTSKLTTTKSGGDSFSGVDSFILDHQCIFFCGGPWVTRNGLVKFALFFIILIALISLTGIGAAQQIPENTYQELHWRMIGPFRGGRTRAVAGVPSQPNVFYMGQVNGGVWKSDDYGRTWNPIFDH